MTVPIRIALLLVAATAAYAPCVLGEDARNTHLDAGSDHLLLDASNAAAEDTQVPGAGRFAYPETAEEQAARFGVNTHRAISNRALRHPGCVVDQYLINELMLSAGITTTSPDGQLSMRLEDGAAHEDEESLSRPRNHFYNPVTNGGLADMFSGTSSLLWAYDHADNNFDWDATRDAFYEALTCADPGTREQRMGDAFFALGHVIHLLEDLAQPQHTRNDTHLSGFPGSPFEDYCVTNYGTAAAVATLGNGAASRPAHVIAGDFASFIAYFDGTNGDLKVATDRSGVWTVDTVDTTGVTGERPAIALDDVENVHVSYVDVTNGALRYARLTGGVWSTETVDGATDPAQTAIAIGPDGNAVITYYDVADGDLEIATYDGATWSLETIDATDDVGTWSAVGASSEATYVAYRNETLSELRVATHDGVSWSIAVVDADGDPGYSTSLAIDTAGRPHVAYLEAATGLAQYAIRATPTLWEGGMVDADPATAVSMSLSENDEPYVAYVKDGDRLYFAAATSCMAVGVNEGVPSLPQLALKHSRPNPFGVETAITFVLGTKVDTRVRIYDAAGRMVRELLDARVGPGPVELTWDGRNDRARPLGAGVYWVQVKTPAITRTGRVVLVR